MKSYSYLVNKQFKVNKRRNSLTIAGIMTSIILFINIGYINNYIKDIDIQRAKNENGNYESIINDVDSKEIDKIIHNVKVLDVGFYKFENSAKVNVGYVEKTLDIIAIDEVCKVKLFNNRLIVKEGRLPKENSEVTLTFAAKSELGKNIGDKINVDDKDYTIVGFYADDEIEVAYNLTGVTYLDINNTNDKINAAIVFKDIKNVVKNTEEIAKLVGIDTNIIDNDIKLKFNNMLLYAYDIDFEKYGGGDNNDWMILIVINLTILGLTMLFVYGAINVALKERVKEFSTLRCIGATPSKIRGLLIKESIFLGVLSLIPGIFIGQILVWFITGIVFGKMIGINNYGVNLSIYPNVILNTVIFTVVNIVISTIIPVVKAGKISPIEGIRENSLTKTLLKPKKSRIIRSLFGYKGELAFKNISSNNKSFLIITATLASILFAFSTFSSFYIFMLNRYKVDMEKSYDISTSYNDVYRFEGDNNGVEVPVEKSMIIRNEINDLGVVGEIYTNIRLKFNGNIKGLTINPKLKSTDSILNYMTKYNDYEDGITVSSGIMLIYDDESLKKILPNIESMNQKDKIKLEDFDDDGFVIVKSGYNNSKLPILVKDEKVKFTFDSDDSKGIEAKTLGVIDSNNMISGKNFGYYNFFTIIVSESFYTKNKEEINKIYYGSPNINLSLNLINNDNKDLDISEVKKIISKQGGIPYEEKKSLEAIKDSNDALAVLIYTTLFLALVIGSINIINSRNINIILRKKEFGTLLAIGINQNELKKVIMLEGILQWFVAGIIGTLLSVITLKLISILIVYNGDLELQAIPIWIIILGLIIMLIINLLSSIIPYKRLKGVDTTKLLRELE